MRTPLRPSDPRTLGGYRMVARLGQGGMGAVYLAEAPGGRPVAIKVIKPEYASEKEFRDRFRSEVNRARQVPPFCTAELLDADADAETPYLVVEYVDGPSLAEVVADNGPLTGGSLHSVAVGVATALAAIHGAGVIHRDLKPANVLFALGAPKVIDFGIARAFEATSQHTGTDQMVGTVAYMAPERFDDDAARLGPAADVFAWGCVVAYAGTGRTPFGGDSAAATAGRILTKPPNLDGLPGPLRDLVARTLDKDPARRPTAFDLLDALVVAGTPTAVALDGQPELAQAARAARQSATASFPATGTGVSGRRRWLAPVLAVVAVLAIGGGTLALTPVGRNLISSGGAGPVVVDPPPASSSSSSSSPAPAGPSASPSFSPSGSAPTSDPSPVPSGAPPIAAPTLSKTAAVALCRDTDVEFTITAQSDNPTKVGPQTGLVTIANNSKTACRVDGHVFVGLYNAADENVRVPATPVDMPDKAVGILLRPGTGAFSGIKWQACDRDSSDCPTGNTLRASFSATASGSVATLEEFPDPLRSLITMKSLQVGTIQPSTEGVVAW